MYSTLRTSGESARRDFNMNLWYLYSNHSLAKALGTWTIIVPSLRATTAVFWNQVIKLALETRISSSFKAACHSSSLVMSLILYSKDKLAIATEHY